MTNSDSRLAAAIRRLTAVGRNPTPPTPRPPRESRTWQQYIESELDSMNRRLTAIESRMTVIYYLVIIVTVTTVINDASAAGRLIQSILQVKP